MCEDVCKQDIVHEVASVRANVSQCECGSKIAGQGENVVIRGRAASARNPHVGPSVDTG